MTRDQDFGPWNPGLTSTIPARLMPRVTLFDPRHSFVTWDEAQELSEAIGLNPLDLAVTRPERLALHSVLIRVTSQLYVPDGPNYADLGINLREMAAKICNEFVAPEMQSVLAAYEEVKSQAQFIIDDLLDKEIYGSLQPAPEKPKGWLSRLFSKPEPPPPAPDKTERALAATQIWKDERNEDIASASRRALARTLGAVLNKRGQLHLEIDIVARVSLGLVMNRLGSAAVGRTVEGIFDKAVERLGYQRLPPQAEPVVLNAKGASASGKSTIRFDQRQIANRLNLSWEDFAIISPDYWRKALLDYDDLGEDYKYAAMMTGNELEVIDRKLDILMAVKGAQGTVPHMLIDRFRFDSFQRDRVREEDSTLLTRFGAKVYMFFLVTPPEATVERAWLRGLDTGRYKAVDDLLFHNIEAYTGIPDLFLRWAMRDGKWVHYEFLDNSVGPDETPRTIAFGQNGKLTILDLACFTNIDRFREVNVDARRPEDVLKRTLSDVEATAFLRRTMDVLREVELATPDGTIFARAENGRIWLDDSNLPEGFDATCLGAHETATEPLGQVQDKDRTETIGA